MKVAVIDYEMSNLFSVVKALQYIGADVHVIQSPLELAHYPRAILPGVGAFADGMANLNKLGWVTAIQDYSLQNYLLGICLGMQLLAEKGDEPVETMGLGIVPGEVIKLEVGSLLKIPHVGWNELKQLRKDPIFYEIADGEDFYFLHSYHLKLLNEKNALSCTDYGPGFISMVAQNKVYGIQCHPEKSGTPGIQLLRNFLKLDS